jgi:long-subunit acyl-CoA synthetase (AMP-forming)
MLIVPPAWSLLDKQRRGLRAPQVDGSADDLGRQPGTSPGARAQPDSMCYIIFTSGSTGRPKGAVLQHAGVINYLHCLTLCALCAVLSHMLDRG